MKKIKYIDHILLLLCCFLQSHLIVAAPAATMAELEAVFLYNFSSFVSWPETSFKQENSPFNICILGKNTDLLATLNATQESEGSTEEGYPLVIKAFNINLAKRIITKKADALKKVSLCHILFVSRKAKEDVDLKKLLQVLVPYPILTVSDFEGFNKLCGMVKFDISEGRIILHMQYPRITQVKLEVASALLELVELDENSACGAQP